MQGIIFIVFLAGFVTLMLRGTVLNRREQYPVLELDAGWQVVRNGAVLEENALTAIDTGPVRKDETFELSRVLEEENVWPTACLFFRNLNTAETLMLDGEEIGSSGETRYAQGRMVGRLVCYVRLPEDWRNRTLTVRMRVAENNAFRGLGPFLLGTEQDLCVRFLKERAVAFCVAVFLLVFGTLQLFWMPLLLQDRSVNKKLLFSALTTVVLGIYLLGFYNLFDLFTDVPAVNTFLEYLALYTIPLVMSGYITTIMEGRMRLLYRVFLYADTLVILAVILLHLTNTMHITVFLIPAYAVCFGESMPFMVHIARRKGLARTEYYDRLEETADRTLAGGFFLYVIGTFIDTVRFVMLQSGGGQEAVARVPFVTVGSLFFSAAICMHYFLIGIVNLRSEATGEILHNRAYSDFLTGLSNRGECDLVLENLAKRHRRFLIISMDLDHLKEVNDTHGHAEGDRMLAGFAGILKTAFEGAELVGRMGGDEFIVVLCGEDCDHAGQYLQRMHDMIDEENKKEMVFRYSVSVGMAGGRRGQKSQRAHDLYMQADRHMYEAKRKRRAEQAMQQTAEAAP